MGSKQTRLSETTQAVSTWVYLMCSQSTPSKKELHLISSTPGAPILCSHSQQNLEETEALPSQREKKTFLSLSLRLAAERKGKKQRSTREMVQCQRVLAGALRMSSDTSKLDPWLSQRWELLEEKSRFLSSSSPSCTSPEGSQNRKVGSL